ncbi:MAG: amidohydrolase family protein [Pseudomonadota bacterium]
MLAAILLAGCAEERAPLPADAVIHNITVVDVEVGETLPNSAVVVADGKISAIVDQARVQNYAAKTLIDGRGGFVMSALADAHVHLQSYSELQNFVLHGVGLVVNMSGGQQHLEMRDAIATKRVLGPRVVTMGPTLDGDPSTNPLFVSVNAESVGNVVDWIADQNYDGVKVYQQMDAGTLSATIGAASRRGLITTGHVSREIGVERALSAGQRYVAHGEELAFEAFDESSRRYDLSAVEPLAAELSQVGATVTPMLAYLQNIPRQVNDLDTYLDTEQMRLVPVAARMSFDRRQGWFANREDPDGFTKQITSLVRFVAVLTTELQQRGVPLVLGTDAGFGGAIPGYGVHEELESLVEAGLTEVAALRSATLDVGKYLKRIDADGTSWGLVKPGYAADLVLLGANPLDDIRATRAITGMMLDGRWIDRSELDGIEATLARLQQTLLPIASAFEDALVAGDVNALDAAIDLVPASMTDEPLISADSCIFLGYRHYYGGSRGLAGRLYQRCAAMHPTSSPLWIHIARSQESEGNTEDAVRSYRRAAELNPWYGDPRAAIDRLGAETND